MTGTERERERGRGERKGGRDRYICSAYRPPKIFSKLKKYIYIGKD